MHVASGKVREIYELDEERLLLVASDRISTFDVVLPTEIPDKGRVLTGLSGFWFARTQEIVPNHLLALRAGRPLDRVQAPRDASDRVRRPRLPRRLGLEGLPGDRRGSVTSLPDGLQESDELPEPIFTPATKAQTGHDENIDRDAGGELVGADAASRGRAHVDRALPLRRGARRERGIIIADTKFEFGHDDEGRIVLGDEALTPDSSRFWPADEYEPGARSPRSTSSSCATTASRSAGTRPPRGPSSRTTSWTGRARATSRLSSG